MKRQALFVLGLVFAFSAVAFAQTKTVTNADLDKFKQKRLQAEKELRENYRELGFPSPDELQKQIEESKKELFALSDRLRAERIEREAAERDSVYSDVGGRYDDPADQKADFIDYQQFSTTTYFPNSYRSRYYRNGRIPGISRVRRNNTGIRFRGFIGNKSRNVNLRNTTFGPSRRLTRQNRIKSRRSDISNFGIGISPRLKRN